MTAMQLLIVDDEPLARQRLRQLIDSLPDLGANVCGEAADAEQAMRLLHTMPVDAVLLDIRMPGAGPHQGMHLAAALKSLPRPPAVIFVTAHAEYALKAFELDAADYLTKPVRRERLLAALQRVQQRLRVPGDTPPEAPALVISDRGRVLRLPLDEVLYLKAELKYVTLRTAGHEHVLDETLSELQQRLGERFIRIHRNTLVGRHAIRALELRAGTDDDGAGDAWAVRLAPLDEWLAVSRRQVAAVRAALAAAGPAR